MYQLRAWAIGLMGLSVACQSVGSEQFTTNTFGAQISFTADAGAREVVAEARILVDGFPVTLVGGDYLTARGGGESRVLLPELDDDGPTGTYSVTFQQSGDNVIFETSLHRATGTVAPTSTVTMPESFEIEEYEDKPSRSTGFTVRWSKPTVDPMWLTLESAGCLNEPIEVEVLSPMDGSQFLTPELLATSDLIVGDICVIYVDLFRRVQGELDSAYGNGNIVGQQWAQLNVATQP